MIFYLMENYAAAGMKQEWRMIVVTGILQSIKRLSKFQILLGFELLLLLYAVSRYAYPLHQYHYQGQDLTGEYCTYLDYVDGYGGCYLDKKQITDNSVDTAYLYITTPYVDLPKGSYEVSIAYDTDENTMTYSATSEFRTYPVITGRESVRLSPFRQEETFSFFSPIAVDEYQLHVNYGGEGALLVKSITIDETYAWKNILLFYIVLFSAIADITILWYQRLSEDKRRSARITIALILGLTIYTSVPVFSYFMYDGDDLPFHLNRIEAIRYSLQAGQFPNRVSAYWSNGYGYASAVFYGELFLYVPAFLRLLGFSVQAAYKFYIVAVNCATACIAYYCFQKIFQNDKAVWVGCAVYMLAPYRLVSIFLRAAVGEYTAMIFFPLIFYGLYRIYMENPDEKNYKKSFVPLLLGCSGILQCHIISCVIAGGFMVLFVLLFLKRTLQRKRLWQLCKAAAGTVLLNLWFLLPFADYFLKDYTASSDSTNVLGRFNANGAFISQMLSFFQKGDYPSYSVAENLVSPNERNYTLGVFLLAAFCYICYRLYYGKEKSAITRIGDYSILFAVISFFMCTVWFPWDFIQQMNGLFLMLTRNIQFPWRFLGVSGFFLTITTICLIMALQKRQSKPLYYGLLVVICSFALLSADYFMYDFMNSVAAGRYIEGNSLDSCAGGAAEYLPDGTPLNFSADTAVIAGDFLTIEKSALEAGVYTVTCSNTSTEETYADIPFIPYAGYVCYDEETEQKFAVSLDVPGKVRAIVPASYQGTFTVVFQEPWYWRVAELISLLSLLAGVCFFYRKT